jgi:hypothetical protein
MSDVQKEMKETLKLLKMIQEKTGVLEARLDFSGGKMSDVFRHLLQWFAEFDSDSGGLIQLQLDLFGSFEAFCNSPVLQGLSAENKVVQWRYLVAAARVEATELQMWKHFELKSERASLLLELEISGQKRSEKLDKQLKDMEKKIKETVENVINPTIRNCFRPEVENIIKDVNYQFQAAAVDFSKPGMFQLYLAKCRFQNLLAHLEMHVAKKLFSEEDLAEILQQPQTTVEPLLEYPRPAQEFQEAASSSESQKKIRKLFSNATFQEVPLSQRGVE